MRTFAGGREIEIPTDSDGYVDVNLLRRTIGVEKDRILMQQLPSGKNIILPKRGRVPVPPFSHHRDAPRSIRG